MHSPLWTPSLTTSIYLLNMKELNAIKNQLNLPVTGNKQALCIAIITYLTTDKKVNPTTPVPQGAYAPKGITRSSIVLHPHAKMYKNTYKNDAKTRAFFKSIIGDHFHFTAYGIDWLNHHWQEGYAPTYQEYIDMWINAQKISLPPKQEWAYIRFTQDYLNTFPDSSAQTVRDAWNKERALHVGYMHTLLQNSRAISDAINLIAKSNKEI